MPLFDAAVEHAVPASGSGNRRSLRGGVAVTAGFLLFLGVAIALQHWSGAYETEFSGYPDEPAHFVAGTMAYAYLSKPPLGPPLPFAADYYVHYPKVAIGHWPPVFPAIQGLWYLAFGVSRTSALLLIAFINSLIAATVFLLVRREWGVLPGIAAALLCQFNPVIWSQGGQIMVDLAVGLFGLWSALSFARYMRTGQASALAWFALLANLAIFTKSSGIFLALVPPVALAITHRLRRLLDPSIWVAALSVAVPTGAWFVLTRHLYLSTWAETPNFAFFVRASLENIRLIEASLGPFFSLLILAGLTRKVALPLFRCEPVEPVWAVLASVTVSVYVTQCVFSAGIEARFMSPALMALYPFLFAGAQWVGRTSRARASGWVAAAVLIVATGVFLWRAFDVPRKPYHGYTEACEYLLSRPESKGAAILTSSEGDGEGLLISEAALRQPVPAMFLLRASKVLASSDWLGRGYQSRFQTPADVARFLASVPVRFLVVERRRGQGVLLHHTLLLRVVEGAGSEWRKVAEFPRNRLAGDAGARVAVYEREGDPGHPELSVRREMGPVVESLLGKALLRRP
jgi:hypothetical protein